MNISSVSTKESSVNKFIAIVIAAILLWSASFAQAQEKTALKSFLKDREYVSVVSDGGPSFNIMLGVVDAFGKAGYILRDEQKPLPKGTRADTWCHVNIRPPALVELECYNPHVLKTVVLVRELITIESASSRTTIQAIPKRIAELRQKHRRAIAALGIKS